MSNDLLKELDTRRRLRDGSTEMACSKAAAAIRALVAVIRPIDTLQLPREAVEGYAKADTDPEEPIVIMLQLTAKELWAMLQQLDLYPLPPKESLQ